MMNDNWDKIDAFFGLLAASLAPAYSASSAYAVGDLCTRAGGLYECNTAIGSGGEAWNAAHWTSASLKTLLAAVATALEGKQNSLSFDGAPTAGSSNPVTSAGIKTALDTKMPGSPQCVEFNPGTGATHGGYIDFHYANSAADFTSRIIESASGHLDITASAGVSVSTAPTHPTPSPSSSDTTSATTAFVHSLLTYGTTDLTAGTSNLTTGVLYFVYE